MRRKEMGEKVLLVSDMPGVGNIALAAMIPILSHRGFHVFHVPTALVSNELDYGKFAIQEIGGYMEKAFSAWEALGFSFDAVFTGFLASIDQAQRLSVYCRKQKEKGIRIFMDPIMADSGALYNGLTEENVMALRELAAVSDYMMPNYTEACFLTGTAYKEEGLPEEELKELLLKLHRLSGGTVIITSVLSEGKNLVAVYDRQDGSFAFLPYRQIPVRIVGTGDIFSAFFMAHILEGRPVTEAVQQTMDTIRDMILTYKDEEDSLQGIPVAEYLRRKS